MILYSSRRIARRRKRPLSVASFKCKLYRVTSFCQDGHALDYQPTPIDTTGITLTPDLLELTEVLARNTHDVWARQRLTSGWRFGPQRDDAAKEHPCLIPYEQLPESEKEYDRCTAMETLKAIAALGYRCEKPPATVPR